MKSRNLRTDLNHYVSLMRRSLNSLCSLGMTNLNFSFLNIMLRYRYLLGGVMPPPYIDIYAKMPRMVFHPGLRFTYSSIFFSLRFLMARRTMRVISQTIPPMMMSWGE